jgi:hypothetical protein
VLSADRQALVKCTWCMAMPTGEAQQMASGQNMLSKRWLLHAVTHREVLQRGTCLVPAWQAAAAGRLPAEQLRAHQRPWAAAQYRRGAGKCQNSLETAYGPIVPGKPLLTGVCLQSSRKIVRRAEALHFPRACSLHQSISSGGPANHLAEV